MRHLMVVTLTVQVRVDVSDVAGITEQGNDVPEDTCKDFVDAMKQGTAHEKFKVVDTTITDAEFYCMKEN